MKKIALISMLVFSLLITAEAGAELEVIEASEPTPNVECHTAAGKMVAEGIVLHLLKAGDVYRVTIPSWNLDTQQPWTKEELAAYITANRTYYEKVAEFEPESDPTLYDGFRLDTPTMRAFVKLVISELNILRAEHGKADRTWEQFLAALRAELEEE